MDGKGDVEETLKAQSLSGRGSTTGIGAGSGNVSDLPTVVTLQDQLLFA